MGWETNRVVFEKGHEVRRDGAGNWLLQSVADGTPEATPSSVTATYGVRPVLCATDRTVNLSPIQVGGEYLEKPLHTIFLDAPKRRQGLAWDVFNAGYTVEGVCYHCKALAEWYAQTGSLWTTILEGPNYDSDMTAGGAVDGYHEFAALVVAAVRSYNPHLSY